jgi:hypothetical protein
MFLSNKIIAYFSVLFWTLEIQDILGLAQEQRNCYVYAKNLYMYKEYLMSKIL